MKKNIIRICKGCKTAKNREDMIKITLSGGKIYINPNSKTTGRSVYVCNNKTCIKNLIKTRGIKKGLKFNNGNLIKEIEEKLNNFNS